MNKRHEALNKKLLAMSAKDYSGIKKIKGKKAIPHSMLYIHRFKEELIKKYNLTSLEVRMSKGLIYHMAGFAIIDNESMEYTIKFGSVNGVEVPNKLNRQYQTSALFTGYVDLLKASSPECVKGFYIEADIKEKEFEDLKEDLRIFAKNNNLSNYTLRI